MVFSSYVWNEYFSMAPNTYWENYCFSFSCAIFLISLWWWWCKRLFSNQSFFYRSEQNSMTLSPTAITQLWPLIDQLTIRWILREALVIVVHASLLWLTMNTKVLNSNTLSDRFFLSFSSLPRNNDDVSSLDWIDT